jgi:serine/threonine protein kinase
MIIRKFILFELEEAETHMEDEIAPVSIAEIQKFQKLPYQFQIASLYLSLDDGLFLLNDEDMWKRSYEIEPKTPKRKLAQRARSGGILNNLFTPVKKQRRLDNVHNVYTIDFENTEDVVYSELLGNSESNTKVYRAVIQGFTCVAKVFETEGLDDFQLRAIESEISIMQKLQYPQTHKNIARYLGHNIMEREICLFMEYYSTTLHSEITARRAKERSYSYEELVQYFVQIAEGIYYLHSLTPPIIHRDLKVAFALFDTCRAKMCF